MKKPHLLIITVILCLVLTGSMSLAKDSGAESIEEFKQAIKIDPDYAKAHKTLAYVYTNFYMYKEAIESLEHVVRINADATSHYNLGFVYGRSGTYKEAIEVLKVAIERDPEHAMSYYNLSILYNSSSDKDSALEQHEILNSLDFDLSDQLLGLIRK